VEENLCVKKISLLRERKIGEICGSGSMHVLYVQYVRTMQTMIRYERIPGIGEKSGQLGKRDNLA
jgi:hypothetical protein